MQEQTGTLVEHLIELRNRFFKVGLIFIAAGIGAYLINAQLTTWLIKPLNDTLVYTSPAGGLNFTLSLIFLTAFIITLPVLLRQIVLFIQPAISNKAGFSLAKLTLVSSILAFLGVLFAYFITLPPALSFLRGFSSDQIESLITTDNYLSFVSIYLGGFAVLFQIPLIVWIINKFTPLKPVKLMKYQRHVVLVSFVVAAILTPTPDPLNQSAMAVPMVLLYQTGVGLVWVNNRNRFDKFTPAVKSSRAEPTIAFDEVLAEISDGNRPKPSAQTPPVRTSGPAIDGFMPLETDNRPTRQEFSRRQAGLRASIRKPSRQPTSSTVFRDRIMDIVC
ncbi:MAG TPA: twin-arginine translocase subunit TatC [Candidatus Saccharimonadales bacterium]